MLEKSPQNTPVNPSVDTDLLHREYDDVLAEISDYADHQTRLKFSWTTTFRDLIGVNSNILLKQTFDELVPKIRKLFSIARFFTETKEEGSAEFIQADRIDNSLTKAHVQLNKAERFAQKAKLYYRIAWGLYLVELLGSITLSHLITPQSKVLQNIVAFLAMGPVPHLLSVEAIITWSSWGIFAILYYYQRKAGFSCEKAALDELTFLSAKKQ